MSYAADTGAKTHYPPEAVQRREREMVDTIARQLDLRPIPEGHIAALSLGVAWGTENAYALTDILAELADRGRERETYAQTRTELVLPGLDQDGPQFFNATEDFHGPHGDADPADHTIPYGWIKAVADAHYGGRVPQVLQDMQLTPAALYEFGIGRIWNHAEELVEQIGRFISGDGQTCPGIFTERLQAVNSYLQQIENDGGDDATAS
jgi:hypothetical protein